MDQRGRLDPDIHRLHFAPNRDVANMAARLSYPVGRLQPTGALREDALYVERTADNELFEALSAGEFCSVLAPRQIGKSSLRIRTARRLQREGIRCAQVDLTMLGKAADGMHVVSWYLSLASRIARDLGLSSPAPFFAAHKELLPIDVFGQYLRKQVLSEISDRIVLFIDEIDYIRSLPIDRDELLVGIRAFYDERANIPDLERLTFCLLGVAAPRYLVKNPEITPFNIGRAIRLLDFSRFEMIAFETALAGAGGAPDRWIDEVYRWTSGHPYMTQALCLHILQRTSLPADSSLSEAVHNAVISRFIHSGRSMDDNLSYAENRLDQSPYKPALLALYSRLLRHDQIMLDPGSAVQQELQFCGMAAPVDIAEGQRALRVRNQIFSHVFDSAWVHEKESRSHLTQAMRRWHSNGRSDNELLRGNDLLKMESWVREHLHSVTAEEHEYLRACLVGARKESEEVWLARDARSQRRSIIGLALIVVILVGLLVGLHGRREAQRLAQKAALAAQEAQQAARDAQHQRDQARYLATSAAESSRRAEESALRERQEATRARAALEAEAVAKARVEHERQRAEEAVRLEKSIRTAMMAAVPGSGVQVVFNGMQIVASDLNWALGPRWEGLQRAVEATALSSLIDGHDLRVTSAEYSPDGSQIVTASWDQTARIWKVADATLHRILTGHTDAVYSASFSPDGRFVVTASRDRTARIWDVNTGKMVHILIGHKDGVGQAVYSSDGRRIVTASWDHTARIWDAETGVSRLTLEGHTASLVSAAFSPTGLRVATASWDHTARTWNAETGELLNELQGHTARLTFITYSPRGERIISAGYDKTARLWNAENGTLLHTFTGHVGGITAARFSPNGEYIVTASWDRTAQVWDAERRHLIAKLQGHGDGLLSAAFSPDSSHVVTASRDESIRLWSLGSDAIPLRSFRGHTDDVHTVSFSPDGQHILTASYDHTARIWSTKDERTVHQFYMRHDSIECAAYSPNGQQLITGGKSGLARVWDINTEKQVLVLRGHQDGVLGAAFSRDGSHIVTASADKTARVWDAKTGSLLLTLQGHTKPLHSAAFSPDGSRIVTGSRDQSARIWDAQMGRLLWTLAGHKEGVYSAAFSPDGSRVITSSWDKTAGVWSVRDGTQLFSLSGHWGSLRWAGYSLDGRFILTASLDGNARIWDAARGTPLIAVRSQSEEVLAAAFSPDGRQVVTAGSSGSVLMHPLDPKALFRFGCRFLRGVQPADLPGSELAALLTQCARKPDRR